MLFHISHFKHSFIFIFYYKSVSIYTKNNQKIAGMNANRSGFVLQTKVQLGYNLPQLIFILDRFVDAKLKIMVVNLWICQWHLSLSKYHHALQTGDFLRNNSLLMIISPYQLQSMTIMTTNRTINTKEYVARDYHQKFKFLFNILSYVPLEVKKNTGAAWVKTKGDST